MGRRIDDIEAYILEAIGNIRQDRTVTAALLADLVAEIKKDNNADTHKSLGLVASKYVETLQRSNEQLVKLTSILNKSQTTSTALDEEDKKELFDMIQGSS